jgi:hypothetical protein
MRDDGYRVIQVKVSRIDELRQKLDGLKQQNTALHKLCGEMVEVIKSYHDPVFYVGSQCKGECTVCDVVNRYEQLEKGE